MKIGILGSGLMGENIGSVFARLGHEVIFSYLRSLEKLQRLADKAGNGTMDLSVWPVEMIFAPTFYCSQLRER